MKKMLSVAVCAILAAGLFVGCGKGVDENRSISEIKTEAASLDTSALKAKVADCEKFLAGKKAELDKVLAKVKEIPLNKILSDESKNLKAEADKLGESIKKVSEQMKVYANEAAEKVKAAAKK